MGNREIRYAVGKGTSNTAKVGAPGKEAAELGSWKVIPANQAQEGGYPWIIFSRRDAAERCRLSGMTLSCSWDADLATNTEMYEQYWALAWVKAEATKPTKKPDVSLIPYFGWLGVIRALEAGNSPVKGYERDDWKPGQKNERSAREHANAVIRHAMRYLDGEILDPETGLPHLDHAATRAMMGREVDTATMRKDFGNG